MKKKRKRESTQVIAIGGSRHGPQPGEVVPRRYSRLEWWLERGGSWSPMLHTNTS